MNAKGTWWESEGSHIAFGAKTSTTYQTRILDIKFVKEGTRDEFGEEGYETHPQPLQDCHVTLLVSTRLLKGFKKEKSNSFSDLEANCARLEVTLPM